MRNFVQPGNVLTLTAPGGDVKSGVGYLIGLLFVVATVDAEAGDKFEGLSEGVVDLPKAGTETFAEGDAAFWDDAAKLFHNHDGDGTFAPVAIAVMDAASADETVRVKLGPVPATPAPLSS